MEEKYEMPIITEWCSVCETEIEMRWDVKKRGFTAFCPVCGNVLMLCDECMHDDDGGKCDFDACGDEICRRRRNGTKKLYKIHVTERKYGVTHVYAETSQAAEKEAEAMFSVTGLGFKWDGFERSFRAEGE